MDVVDTLPFEFELGLLNLPLDHGEPLPTDPPKRFADTVAYGTTLQLPGNTLGDEKANGITVNKYNLG